MHQHSSIHCHTPHQASIRTHPSAIHTYLYSLLSRTYFVVPCLSHHLGFLNAGKDGVLHRLVSVSTSVGSSDWTLHRSPSTFVFPSAFFLSPRFWFIYSRCDLVRPYPYQLSRLLHFLYNVYLFLDVRYALYSSAHSHSLPLPLPLLFQSFLPSIGIIEMVFVTSFRCENKDILVRRFFFGSLCYPGGIKWLCFS